MKFVTADRLIQMKKDNEIYYSETTTQGLGKWAVLHKDNTETSVYTNSEETRKAREL